MSTSTTLFTADGDTLDHICWRHYGDTAGRVVEQVLTANRGLADRAERAARPDDDPGEGCAL